MSQNPANPSRQVEMPGSIVRFGPAGWLTVVTALTGNAEIELCPTGRVLAVTDLREVAVPDHQPSADG